jgi:copper chaperone CopZ
MTKTMTIEGMTCGHCKARVEKTLAGVEGVLSAQVDLALKQAVVTMDQDIADSVLIDAVDDAGYDVVSVE